VDGYQYRLNKESANTYSYLFANVREDTDFRVYAGRYGSDTETLNVLPKPKMVDFQIELSYPRYTGRRSEVLKSTGDFTAPEGTKASWTFDTKSTDDVSLTYGDDAPINLDKSSDITYAYNKSIYSDVYPQINVEVVKDSTAEDLYYFIGSASDDYALTKLKFVFEQVNEQGITVQQGS